MKNCNLQLQMTRMDLIVNGFEIFVVKCVMSVNSKDKSPVWMHDNWFFCSLMCLFWPLVFWIQVVQDDGGFNVVNRNTKWPKIASRLGYSETFGIVFQGHYERILFPYDIFLAKVASSLVSVQFGFLCFSFLSWTCWAVFAYCSFASIVEYWRNCLLFFSALSVLQKCLYAKLSFSIDI